MRTDSRQQLLAVLSALRRNCSCAHSHGCCSRQLPTLESCAAYRWHGSRRITTHACQQDLRGVTAAHQQAYPGMFHGLVDEQFLMGICRNAGVCGVFRDDPVKKKIAAMAGRSVPTGKSGRPGRSLKEKRSSPKPFTCYQYFMTRKISNLHNFCDISCARKKQ